MQSDLFGRHDPSLSNEDNAEQRAMSECLALLIRQHFQFMTIIKMLFETVSIHCSRLAAAGWIRWTGDLRATVVETDLLEIDCNCLRAPYDDLGWIVDRLLTKNRHDGSKRYRLPGERQRPPAQTPG